MRRSLCDLAPGFLFSGLSLLALACSDKTVGTPLADGGGFVLPDARIADLPDAQVRADSGPRVDAGPFVCDPVCEQGLVCACPDTFPLRCGCVQPATLSRPCDPAVPESCQAGLDCVEALKFDRFEHVCSDGSEGTPCSRSEPSCTTTNGCVCLSGSPLGTSCACQGSPRAGGPCDPNAPTPCPIPMTCVPVGAANQNVWYCSDGADGSPCVPIEHEAHCDTELGCTCPIYLGTPTCVCRNRGSAGQLCDPTIAVSCLPGLMCRLMQEGDTPNEQSSRCFGQPTEILCDPLNPVSCPPGSTCEQARDGRFICRAESRDGGFGGQACIPGGNDCLPGYECREVSLGVFQCEAILGDPDAGMGMGQACDPLEPFCPVGQFCVEVQPGDWQCRSP